MILHASSIAVPTTTQHRSSILCDTCGQQIASLGDGLMEWLVDGDGRAYGLRIAHHAASCRGCRLYLHRPNECNHPLYDFATRTGIEYWLARTDQGHVRKPT